MNQAAERILWQVRAAGGSIEPAGDRGERLRLMAPEPLPDDLVAAVQAHKPEILAALRRMQNSPVSPRDPGEGGHVHMCSDTNADTSVEELLGRHSVVYLRSRVLEEVVTWATDDVEVSSGPEVVYREIELDQLVGRDPEEVLAIHAVKAVLDGERLDDEVWP